jgi:Polyketide cyclase / dehydrase and lipid transport
MASIRKEILVAASPERVWAALRDVGAVHTRLVQQMVVDTHLEGDSRLVTFANGEVVRERIVGIDDRTRRLAYAAVEWRTTHHNASFEVVPEGDGCSRLVWITDLLPDTLTELVDGLMEQGCVAIKRTLEMDPQS